MKKLLNVFSATIILFIAMGIIACNNGTTDNNFSTESFSKTTVFNPNSTKVRLISLSAKTSRSASVTDGEEVCEIEPLEKKEVELGSEHEYFFTDSEGNKIADISKSDDGQYLPVYLELNEPKEGKEYLLLNQYKNDNLLEKFSRYKDDGTTYETYGLLLYEVVDANDVDAYKFNNETFIRTYPSANYWIDSKGYASNKIGTKITYDENFKNNFTPLSDSWVAWGWSTRNEEFDMWFCHRVVSYVLHAKDGNTYTDKTIGEQASVQTNIQAVYSENPNWTESWSTSIPSTETTKWKVTEIWFYSTQKLYYETEFNSLSQGLQAELRKKIADCRLFLSPLEKSSYNGWMPQNCEYALCMRLESKNCYVQDVWCETIATSLLQEVYNMMIKSAPDFIINY